MGRAELGCLLPFPFGGVVLFTAMAAGGADPRAVDVEEDASQLVFPKGESGGGAGNSFKRRMMQGVQFRGWETHVAGILLPSVISQMEIGGPPLISLLALPVCF